MNDSVLFDSYLIPKTQHLTDKEYVETFFIQNQTSERFQVSQNEWQIQFLSIPPGVDRQLLYETKISFKSGKDLWHLTLVQ